jgi:5-formyltetrahydrofolate cyclo-ligase
VTDKQAAAEKQALRSRLRAARRAHVEGLDPRTRALLFRRPPAPLLDLIPANAVIGVYNAGRWEAPAASYAAFFHEAGHAVALPWFATREAPMQFRQWQVPRSTKISKPIPGASNSPRPCAGNDSECAVRAPRRLYGAGRAPGPGRRPLRPLVFRQPRRHRDRHGLGRAMRRRPPHEAHDHPLRAVVTPTRLYGPF